MTTGTVELVVLGSTKTGERSLVLHTLSREYGRRGFLVTVGKHTSPALFFPLNILEAEIVPNPKSTLWRARGLQSRDPLNGIRSDLRKNAMSLFLSEVLMRTLRDGTPDNGLYDWAVRSILTLDSLTDGFPNFHVRFLLELASVLGFRPTAEGLAPFAGEDWKVLNRFIAADPGESLLIPMTGDARTRVCRALLQYLEYHTESAIHVRSLDVLSELF